MLSNRALNRALLARQWLLERRAATAVEAVEHLVGLQAQAPEGPYVGLWSRLDAFDPDQVGQLLVERVLVRISLLRATLHLVTAHDAVAIRPVVQPRLDRQVYLGGSTQERIDGVDLAAVASVARDLLDDEPRSLAELAPLLAPHFPGLNPRAVAAAVPIVVPVVHVPPRGVWRRSGPARLTGLEAWVGRPLDARPSIERLVERYLDAFGPASVADAQTWCGLTGLAPVFDRLRPQLRTFRSERGVELFDRPDAPRPDPDSPAPARLVAEFDNLLLSHADRTRVVADADRARVMSRNGIVSPTILVDGAVCGGWRRQRDGGRHGTATVRLSPFRSIPRADRSALREEAGRLLDMTDPDRPHAVRFDPVR